MLFLLNRWNALHLSSSTVDEEFKEARENSLLLKKNAYFSFILLLFCLML